MITVDTQLAQDAALSFDNILGEHIVLTPADIELIVQRHITAVIQASRGDIEGLTLTLQRSRAHFSEIGLKLNRFDT